MFQFSRRATAIIHWLFHAITKLLILLNQQQDRCTSLGRYSRLIKKRDPQPKNEPILMSP